MRNSTPWSFWCDRVILGELHDVDAFERYLVAPRGSPILAHSAADDDRRFLRQNADAVPALLIDVLFCRNDLDDASAIADQQERDLAAGSLVVDPATQRDDVTGVSSQILDVDDLLHSPSLRLVPTVWESPSDTTDH